jgi:hypothetical protein
MFRDLAGAHPQAIQLVLRLIGPPAVTSGLTMLTDAQIAGLHRGG